MAYELEQHHRTVPEHEGVGDHTIKRDKADPTAVYVDSKTVAVAIYMEQDANYHYNAYQRGLLVIQEAVARFYVLHKKVLWAVLVLLIFLAYTVYFGLALNYRFGDEGSWRLLCVTIFGVLLFILILLSDAYKTKLDTICTNSYSFRNSRSAKKYMKVISWFLRIGVLVTLVIYVIMDIAIDHPQNLISVAGLILYILLFYITSVNPAKVNWHTVYWGIALQYVFALIILRSQWGYDIFKWTGDRVTEFLEHTMAGIVFAFGDTWFEHFVAMKVLPIVVFFFTCMNILYYLGVMQAFIKVIGGFLAFSLGTTPAESINAASNIFGSMIDSPMMIRPFLKDMTQSELHAVMTCGFATIAGNVLGVYIIFGVPAIHLLSASVMSAPAALTIAKLSYPETERSKASIKDFSNLEKPPEHNIIEAASNGASSGIKVVCAIAVNLIAFLSLLAFLNATLTWFGERVGIEDLTFEFICSYVLYPLAYLMGVEGDDCRKVAELIGVKSFTNEFIAYSKLKTLIQNRKDLGNYTKYFDTTDWYWEGNNVVLNITGQILEGGFISEKSEIISTYALCNFANFGSIGITLGVFGALAPTRKSDSSQLVMRAMICGNVACFFTACIAGLLYKSY